MTSVIASAPARVNIIGEHTDYNDGLVLPTCTGLFTHVRATARDDRELHVSSTLARNTEVFDLGRLQATQSGSWLEYVKGVVAGLLDKGVGLPGADVRISGEIPLGAGLSSSASLELSVAKALLELAGASMDATELALLCQTAEHKYAGVHCGIMDQFALACALRGSALLLDCRNLQVEHVALPDEITFILTDSGVRHSLVDGEYNNRADECAAAVATIAANNPGVSALRDVDNSMLQASRNELGDVLSRRSRHVVSENKRVRDMVSALNEKDLEQVGALLTACHESLRDDFEVSCEELDLLVEVADSSDLVLGSRMVGAGFGGCVLSACFADTVDEAAAEIRSGYARASGAEPWQHVVVAAHPAQAKASA